ncbi:MAG: sulfate permease [Cellulomonadaceae bacterium]|nr:sulfate permease [Cellulomonadaceae bacterium]
MILGIVLVLGGFVVLGDAFIATVVSIFVIAWTTLISGAVLLIAAITRIGKPGFWSAALGGAILVVLGLFYLRNPLLGALSLTLLAGALFFTTGLTRIVAAFAQTELRALLIFSGALSLILGLWVLFNPIEATLQLLGILLGVQILVEGLTLITVGRLRPSKAPAAVAAES